MAQTPFTPPPHLHEDVTRAVDVLHKLTDPAHHRKFSGVDTMSGSELFMCSGVVYHRVWKAGFGLSVEHGRGMVLNKIYTTTGATTPADMYNANNNTTATKFWSWSPPLFITVNAASIGATLGYAEIDSYTILDTPEAVQSFSKSYVELDTVLNAAVGSAAATSLPATAVNISNTKLGDKEFTYSVVASEGLIFDVSLAGVQYSVDENKNDEAYGGGGGGGIVVTPQQILNGGVGMHGEMKTEMDVLYNALDQVILGYMGSDEYQVQLRQQQQQRRRQHQE